ncbi:MAG: hypothetical protein JO171_00715 [Paludibacterium sp.]|uniref:hypothetical protein n=1 Tax=Paludibacterium sp. TaxID=1917523 RepID=UPI0025F127E7|nr:hypothetical protein [Paludibacterium sp.]MBV8045645.1 hypothetical protein [Paludibacterium sp.]MBV8647525.1 hypothetical protein [Paludibacterium sp.]
MTPAIADLLDRFPLMVDAELKRILDLSRPAREAAAKSAMTEMQQCVTTKSYLTYSAAAAVADDVTAISQGKKSMNEVMRLGLQGDVIGIHEQSANVQNYVRAHDSLKDDWQQYRSLGGKASSPAKVKPGLNPCGKLQDIIDHGQG